MVRVQQRTYYLYRNGDPSNTPYEFLYDNDKIKSFDVLLAVLTELVGRQIRGGRVLKLYRCEKVPIPRRICTLVELERLADSQCVFAGNEPYVKITGGYGERAPADNVSVMPHWRKSDTRRRVGTAVSAIIGYDWPPSPTGQQSSGSTSVRPSRSISAMIGAMLDSQPQDRAKTLTKTSRDHKKEPEIAVSRRYERSRTGAIVSAGTTSSYEDYRLESGNTGTNSSSRSHSVDTTHSWRQPTATTAAHSGVAGSRRSNRYSISISATSSSRRSDSPQTSDGGSSYYGRRGPQSSVSARKYSIDSRSTVSISDLKLDSTAQTTMTTAIEYREYETDGGLMDQIESLTAPPAFSGKETERLWHARKPGAAPLARWKGANSQYCNSCQEGGELLCCDHCPASFHLLCLDPPLDSSCVPEGKWQCKRCQLLPELNDLFVLKNGNIVAKNSISSLKNNALSNGTSTTNGKTKPPAAVASTAAGSSAKASIKKQTKTGKKTTAAASAAADKLGTRNASEEPSGTPEPESFVGAQRLLNVLDESNRNAFAAAVCAERAVSQKLGPDEAAVPPGDAISILCEAARALNPTEFRLPEAIQPDRSFPGDPCAYQPSSASTSQSGSSGSSTMTRPAWLKQRVHEPDANGCVQRPLKLCFQCSRSAAQAPLLKCDFCPALYHLDCLDPPLSTVPRKSLWMCPNHVQPYLDSHLLQSVSYTERSRLWSTHAECPVDEELIKTAFLDKARAGRSMGFRRNQQRPPTIRPAKVPAAIKQLYKQRVNRSPPVSVSDQATFLSALIEWEKQQVVGDRSQQADCEPSAKRRCPDDPPPSSSSSYVEQLHRADTHLRRLADRTKPCLSQLNFHPAAFNRTLPVLACVYVHNTGAVLPVQHTVCTVGLQPCHLNLLNADAKCSKLLLHHATIVFNKTSRSFELLNYSPSGVTVDGVRYGMDVTAQHTAQIPNVDDVLRAPIESAVRALLAEDHIGRLSIPGTAETSAADYALLRRNPTEKPPAKLEPTDYTCVCDVTGSCTAGRSPVQLEGAAPLTHSSCIQIGCLRMTFAHVHL